MRANVIVLVFPLISISSENRVRRELDPQTCVADFDVQPDKIIRTEESRELGARYLSELDVGAREECLRLCCETDACDVFVYEEKSPGSCYLFSCGPPEDFKCKFTRHSNFSSGVMAVSRHLAELRDQVRLAKHEHDLASLRKSVETAPSTVRPTPPTTSTTTSTHIPPSTSPTQRRCSPYQFECHGSGECIAIYNACDGVPQCADASDEAPELGCPAAAAPVAPRRDEPAEQLVAQKMTGAEAVAPFLRGGSGDYASPRWPHRLMQAQSQQPLKPYAENSQSSHIFTHKTSLLQEGESQPQQQYVPLENMQETQWIRRPWQQSPPMEQMPMNDRQLMYRYGVEPWRQPADQMSRDRALVPDRDKMWAVPQSQAIKPAREEMPLYQPAKTVPESPLPYSNAGTLRDSAKKGFDLAPHHAAPESPLVEPERPVVVKEAPRAPEATKTTPVDRPAEKKDTAKVDNENKHDMKHDQYALVEDVHEGLSEKPAGAILLLILGVLMTGIMAVMLGCRLRVARRRLRRAGKSPFAHDADYLVNGMYL